MALTLINYIPQVEGDRMAIENLLKGVTKGYIDGKPPVLRTPEDSLFHVVRIPNYRQLSAIELADRFPPSLMLDRLSEGKVIVIQHDPHMEFLSFGKAMDAIAQRDQTLEVQGMCFCYVCPQNHSHVITNRLLH